MKMTTSPQWNKNTMQEYPLIIGTRKSQLAVWQAEYIGRLLSERHAGFSYQLRMFVTTGDRKLEQPLPEIGGKGLFTQELEEALHSRDIHLVVHSLKDLPVEESQGLMIAAVPVRDNARDVLVSARGYTLDTLPEAARVGTSSLRRAAQLLHLRPDLTLKSLRGNIDTRLRKASEGEYDAIVLAAAGIYRLGLQDYISEELSFEQMLPAPGQGALAVQCRSDDALLRQLLKDIDHIETRVAVTAERVFLKGLGGGCAAPVAAYGVVEAGMLNLEGLVASLDGRDLVRVSGRGQIGLDEARMLGLELARQALDMGAGRFLKTEAVQ
jgi:hydroxymethylbilane synthase